MGFGKRLKKLFGSDKKEEKNVVDEIINKPIEMDEKEQTLSDDEATIKPKNFKYLDGLIPKLKHSSPSHFRPLLPSYNLDELILKLKHSSPSHFRLRSPLYNYDVFISYSSKDAKNANEICRFLEQNNLNCWIAPRNLSEGVHYLDDIYNAIKSSKNFVLVFSKFSIDSQYVKNELNNAVKLGKNIISIIKTDNSFPISEIADLLQDAYDLNLNSDLIYIINTNLDTDVDTNKIMPVQIYLDSDIILDDDEVSKYIDGIKLIHDNLIIDGNNHTIDARGKARIFNCKGNITIKNIILKNGCHDNGGAILNSKAKLEKGFDKMRTGGELTIMDSTLSGNTAQDGAGAAICNREGNFKVINCIFSNNRSPIDIVHNLDSFQVHNSDFIANHAKNVIVNDDGDFSKLGIFNGKFKDNNIGESVINNKGQCTVEKTVFEKNPSNTIKNKIFKSYPAIKNMGDLTLIDSKINYGGKTILNEKYIFVKRSRDGIEKNIYGKGTVENRIVIPIEEKFDFGYLDKKIHGSKTKEIILEQDISFENYETDYYEGGIELDIDNLIIDGNGHTIDAQQKTRIFHCTAKNITIKNIILKNGRIHKNYDNPFNNNGGAIRINHDVKLTLKNCKFISNISEKNGGAIDNAGELIVAESSLMENTSKENGGAIHNEGELTLFESSLMENTSKENGGAIYNVGKINISDSILNKNTSPIRSGAIHNVGELAISDSTLTENTAEYGGAIYNYCELIITGSTFSGNYSIEDGGAIDNVGELTVISSEFTGNRCGMGGGAILAGGIPNVGAPPIGGRLRISDSKFTGNSASYQGGAIFYWSGEVTISDSTFTENRAGNGGGAVYLGMFSSNSFEPNNCAFNDNKPEDVSREI